MIFVICLVILMVWNSSTVSACSDVLINTTLPTEVISARTMDLQADLHTILDAIPAGTLFYDFPVQNCPDCPDFSYTSKYGMVAFNMYGVNEASDGLNTAGLSVACLYLENTQFPTLNTSQNARPIVSSFVTYALAMFGSVKDVKKGLQYIQVGSLEPKMFAKPPLHPNIQSESENTPMSLVPLHYAIHDAYGNSLVIEGINGTLLVVDNRNGVLTNEPPLAEQLELLQKFKQDNYENHAIPGDFGSISRFQRLSLLNEVASVPFPSNTSFNIVDSPEQALIATAVRIVNTVVRPTGSGGSLQFKGGDITQWSVVRDHQRRKLYFQTTQNQVLRCIDFIKLGLDQPYFKRKSISTNTADWNIDITALLQHSNLLHPFDILPRAQMVPLYYTQFTSDPVPIPVAVVNDASGMSSIWWIFIGISIGVTSTLVYERYLVSKSILYNRI